MQAHYRFGFTFHGCSQGFPSCINLFGILFYISSLYSHWSHLTPCFQRQGVVIGITLVYWQLKLLVQPSYLVESLQFLITFILTEKLNAADQLSIESCLKTTDMFTKITYTLYFFLYGYYVATIIVFALLLLGSILYDCYYHTVILPRRNRLTSIRGREFNELETIKYNKIVGSVSESELSCSICLTDFDENEMVIRLPVCWHHFHKTCIKIWLQNHRECPYCRADIKVNLKLWKQNGKKDPRDGENRSTQNKGSTMTNPIEMENIFSQPADSHRNEGLVYVELRDL